MLRSHVSSLSRLALACLWLSCVVPDSPAAEQASVTAAGAALYAYDAVTDQAEVRTTLERLVREDAANRKVRQIYVITGVHGEKDGSVDLRKADVQFQREDRETTNQLRNNMNIRDYAVLAPLRWKELSDKKDAVIVLAWCYSQQWLTNNTDAGNNGKIRMRQVR